MTSPTTGLRATVVFESMFGNTRLVAEAVADGLRAAGAEVSVECVRRDLAAAPDADLVVVGAPTHAFSLSRPSTRRAAVEQGADPVDPDHGMREWLEGWPRAGADAPAVAVFDTRATKVRRLPKAAGTRAARLLRRRGYRLIEPPAAFLVGDVAGPLEDGELDHARTWGRGLADLTSARMPA